jgi:sulfur-oxidizing protein SoxX
MKKSIRYGLLLSVFALVSCTDGKHSPLGFSLPEGNADAGKSAFVELACNACHSTPDIDQLEGDVSENISVSLGGSVQSVKTYAGLVTSIINPSHRISKTRPPVMMAEPGVSPMPIYNSMMTVEQLTDLVTYLQPHYKLQVYDRTMYRPFRSPSL